jgi:hypothetical protein
MFKYELFQFFELLIIFKINFIAITQLLIPKNKILCIADCLNL